LDRDAVHHRNKPLDSTGSKFALTFLCWEVSSSQLSFLTRRGIEPLGQAMPLFGWLLLSTVGVDALASPGSWGGAGPTLCLAEDRPWAKGFVQFPLKLPLEELFLAMIPVQIGSGCLQDSSNRSHPTASATFIKQSANTREVFFLNSFVSNQNYSDSIS
jgi:hypothetical protein